MSSDENFLVKNANLILTEMGSAFKVQASGSESPTEPLKETKPKAEEKTMKTQKKVHKIGKGKPVEKLLSRLTSLQTFDRLSIKIDRWAGEEPNNDNKAALLTLKETLASLEAKRNDAVKQAATLQALGYKPPKRQGIAGLKFDTNKHVWIKPKYVAPFKTAYGDEALAKLFVSEVVDGRVLVSLGDPSQGTPTFKFLVPKQQIQMSQPE